MDSFWHELKKPIVGLSAMDGVTDAAMREITARVGKPDFMVTEFTSAEGVARQASRLLRDFYYTDTQRPIVAQIFGAEPAAFRLTAILCCFLGFEGIDINMGCPADSVARKGGGAALINTPKLAQELVRSVRQGIDEYVNGIELMELGLSPDFLHLIQTRVKQSSEDVRKPVPVSIKTRIGYDRPVIESWIPALLETEPALITLHGRTLTQQYSGSADWDQIAKAAELIHQTDTLVFGNGDLVSPQGIVERISASNVDGVMIGRAAMGNPWIFSQYRDFVAGRQVQTPSREERFETAIMHAQIFEELNGTAFAADPLPFLNMRKHLGWYIKGFPNASELRSELFQANSLADVKRILGAYSANDPGSQNP